ncbi:hypothetical protein J2790_002616 [Paenarthrobacter nicotinovorans]|uniref:hypothetical protein n=1 Tax=Micrococcaceae TaxID=1268 RepID=UPI00047ED912|nr:MULTISPECIES: hypothetical protein [Micrococcaceae]MDR6437473.1 hypothetical protein [Paenarthrobacter nicotinovorans]SCZ53153.1 hypothetical protein SAMN02799638_01139 [Arthrobacter sp. UNCCL28]
MTATHRSRHRRVLPAAAIILLTLAGCGTTPSTNSPTSAVEQTMDPEQARAEYFELFNKIQALAPGDWGVAPPSEFQGDACRLPDGTDGTQFSVNTSRSPLSREEMDALHEKVRAEFETTGFTVRQSTDGGENFVRRTSVFGPEKFVMGITTGKYGIALSGNTRCVPDPEGEFR